MEINLWQPGYIEVFEAGNFIAGIDPEKPSFINRIVEFTKRRERPQCQSSSEAVSKMWNIINDWMIPIINLFEYMSQNSDCLLLGQHEHVDIDLPGIKRVNDLGPYKSILNGKTLAEYLAMHTKPLQNTYAYSVEYTYEKSGMKTMVLYTKKTKSYLIRGYNATREAADVALATFHMAYDGTVIAVSFITSTGYEILKVFYDNIYDVIILSGVGYTIFLVSGLGPTAMFLAGAGGIGLWSVDKFPNIFGIKNTLLGAAALAAGAIAVNYLLPRSGPGGVEDNQNTKRRRIN